MSITLNHTIVPARDKEAAARLFAQLFYLTYEGASEGAVADVVEIWMTLSPAFSGYRVMRQRQAFADPS